MTLLSTGGWDPIIFPEIRAGIVALWKGAFGENADTDPNTPDGLEISIIAGQLMLAFDVDTGLWDNSFFRSATGVALDRLLDMFASEREPATASVGTEIFYGTPGTVVPAGTVVITTDSVENRFATDIIGTVGAASNSNAWVVRIQTPIDVGASYIVQVDANPALAQVALISDDTTDIARGLRDQLNGQGFATAALAGVDTAGSALLVVELVGGGTGNVSTTGTGTALLDDLEAVRVAITATITGAVLGAAGTIQDLANPIVGIVGVTNDTDVTPGTAEQNDDEFRAAHLETLFKNTARTDSGMRAAVSKVLAVDQNSVVSNRSDAVDAGGRDPHSVENIVLYKEGQSDDQAVADAIARQIPAGIQPFGATSFGLGTTVDGEVIEVFGALAEELYLHLSITVTKGEDFPETLTESAIATAIATYFDAGIVQLSTSVFIDTTAKLVLDKDMLRTAATVPINLLSNTTAASIGVLTDTTALPTDVPVFAAADRPADERQIIRADASRIAVTIV